MDIAKSIKAINPTAEFKYSNEDSSTLEWLSGTTPISKSDIEAKMAELQAEYDSQDYARNRQAEYPSIGDQLDMLWHAIDVGDWTAAKVKTTSFYTELKAVKDANPKP